MKSTKPALAWKSPGKGFLCLAISTYQVWEEGNHPQISETEAVMRQKLEYIHQNPVKRGYVDLLEHWRYSNTRSYAGQEGLIEVTQMW